MNLTNMFDGVLTRRANSVNCTSIGGYVWDATQSVNVDVGTFFLQKD
jgi:hypothetical protein